MKYTFKKIDNFWQDYWIGSKIFEAKNIYNLKKCYILDMFPYPSGEGLHIGHPLGYIVSDIYARFKLSEGLNVLHPIGFDSFGLPTEQYAIYTGKHPSISTANNIKIYKKQLEKLGFSFDWKREIRTSDPYYYRWTQWIFLQFLNSWYDKKLKKTRNIVELTRIFEKEGNWKVKAFTVKKIKKFSYEAWKKFSFKKQYEILQNYRLAYRERSTVNWCKDLGTVLANDEVKNGRSERGGYRIYKKKKIQWNMHIISYADRLLSGVNEIEWPVALKEYQQSWIRQSVGAIIFFSIITHSLCLEVFTLQPYTIFEVSFILLATEHPIIKYLIIDRYKKEVEEYMQNIKIKNELFRTSKFKNGIFLGFYVENPFTKNEIPIYISDYVLESYGPVSFMIGPFHENRDHIKSFNITYVIPHNIKSTIKKMIEKGVGYGIINYRLRDVVFSRQRYWGEPIPLYYKKNVNICFIPENKLPLLLPEIDKFHPTDNGSPPLKRAKHWSWYEIKNNVIINNKYHKYPIETSTMPVCAGSSWYMARYMNTKIKELFIDNEAYWKNIDLYIGGAEHATGHLIYTRFWHKILKDLHWINAEEPIRKLINQGMILGHSAFVARVNDTDKFLSAGIINNIYNIQNIPINIHLLKKDNILYLERFKFWRKDFYKADLITENGLFYCQRAVEKMSKSKYNVINPNKICYKYGADTLRLYEMFLGPIKQDKPWNNQGINGVYNFIKKLWFFYYKKGYLFVEDSIPSFIECKLLHSIVKKVKEYMVFFSFNTFISAFMIIVNELSAIKCRKISILEPIVLLIAPFAPHFSEQLWNGIGYKNPIIFYTIYTYDVKFILEETIQYSILKNGKLFFKMSLTFLENEISMIFRVLKTPKIYQYSKTNTINKIIFIHYLIVNFIVSG